MEMELGVVAHTCNPSTGEREDGDSEASLGCTVRSCLKQNKTKHKWK
jgi:hypothetical protein